MTQQHPITPPPELVQQWINEEPGIFAEHIALRAAQWGADQELEACLNWLTDRKRFPVGHEAIEELRAARRPKPPSLKQQALEAMREMQIEPCVINGVNTNAGLQAKYDTIRRALEQLPDNE